jgi:hypothetical protein
LLTGARRSKRRASDSNVEVALKAEKLMVLKNEGNSASIPSRVSFDNVSIIPNLNHIGISIGDDEGSISKDILELYRAVEFSSGEIRGVDKKLEVMELEEKDLQDEEEIESVTSKYLWRDNGGGNGGDDSVIPPSHLAKQKSHRKRGKASDQKRVK